MGNLRETEIFISHLGNYGKYVRFPTISPTKHVVKFHHFLLADFVYMIQNPSRGTVKYNEISPYFFMGEFCRNGHISHDFPKEKWKFPFPLNFL